MPETPHLNPLPSRKGRGGQMLGRPGCPPKARDGTGSANRWTSGATRPPYRVHLTKLVIAMWIFAVAVRLILIDQPYVDLLQICRHSRVDWAQPVRDFLCYLAPIFLFARARNVAWHSRP